MDLEERHVNPDESLYRPDPVRCSLLLSCLLDLLYANIKDAYSSTTLSPLCSSYHNGMGSYPGS